MRQLDGPGVLPCASPSCVEGTGKLWVIWTGRGQRERKVFSMKPHGAKEYVNVYLWGRA
jgi:hypothetical protein